MTYATIRTETSARGVATVTLNRPDKLNAFNQDMIEELHRHVGELAGDARVRVMVLRAAGKHFSAGADVARPAARERQIEPRPAADRLRPAKRLVPQRQSAGSTARQLLRGRQS